MNLNITKTLNAHKQKEFFLIKLSIIFVVVILFGIAVAC